MTVTGDRETGVWQACASSPVFPVLAGSAAMAPALNHRMRAGLGTARLRDRRVPSRG